METGIIGLALLALTATANTRTVGAQAESQSRIGSPQTAELLQRLEDAEYADRGNSISFGDNPTLGHYYRRKADEVNAVIKRLENGQSVPREEVEHALDNSEASHY
jgi:hypothetical protein